MKALFVYACFLMGMRLAAPTALAEDPAPAREFTNRLIHEKSPYLLQHAHNPVDWHPWGEDAFAQARRENKPIFLSVGYSTCHWCHVMERESFENPQIAAYLNAHFVSIKVDREERPDVDGVYMTFVQAATGGGGWPMSVWLTPELQPFVGGTYFPPDDAIGRRGFLSVLKQLAGAWTKDEKQIRAQAGQITQQLQRLASGRENSGAALNASALTAGLQEMANRFDAQDGGFGAAPKFPRPSELQFLFHEAHRVGPETKAGKRALEMAVFTLEKITQGGIHDHLGGGFHRYSVDGKWHVPHFEKMLYDQAQLVEACLTAYQITGRREFSEAARDTLDYVLRDLTSPEGGFYSAEDADSAPRTGSTEKAEGAYYVWTKPEIEEALGPDRAAEIDYFYGVEPGGNTPAEGDPHGELRGRNVLRQRHTAEAAAKEFRLSTEEMKKRLAESRGKLLARRVLRPHPHRDDKTITAWNGLMITACAKAYQILGDERYLDAANRAADFVRQNLCDAHGQTLQRAWRGNATNSGGFAEDYAFLIRGLIDLYEAGFDPGRLAWAITLQKKQDELFWDDQNNGYFSSTGKDSSVLMRMKETYDGAEPSPNTIVALNLLRLSRLLGDLAWNEKAERTLKSLVAQMQQSPRAAPMGLVALGAFLAPSQQIVIVGKKSAPETREMLRTLWQKFLASSVWVLIDDEASRAFFANGAEFYRSVQAVDGKPTAYVCSNFVCHLPTSNLSIFETELANLNRAPSKK